MPWLETSPVEQRKEFIEALLEGAHTFTEVCRRFGISRKNGYKWLRRYERQQALGHNESFENRSRRPRRSPNAVAAEVEEAIVGVRKMRPHWGPKKLRVVLAKEYPAIKMPSESTIAAVLKRRGLVKPRRKRTKTTPYSAPLAHATHPNALWAIDFKGDFALGRTRCYPLTVTDVYSRYIIACVALTSTRLVPTRRALERIFDEFGLPDAIRTDNGSPFSAKGLAGLSQLSVWWHKIGVRHERIEPGHPEQNGRHERMHRDLKRETTCPPAKTIPRQQRLFDEFRARYNLDRPHEALGQRTPHSLYEPSLRSLPVPRWGKHFEYEFDEDVHTVSNLGYVTTHRGMFFLSTTLACERVKLDWSTGNYAKVWFGPMLLGELHAKRKRSDIRFIPVESVAPFVSTSAPPVTNDYEEELSPMSSDNVPF